MKRLSFKEGFGGAVRVFSFTVADGLTTNCIYQFFEDKQGYFWLMSDSGILRIRKHELNRYARANGTATTETGETSDVETSDVETADVETADVETSKFEKINCISYGLSDGMKSLEFNNEFSRSSALKSAEGELWFITKKGITIVHPEKIRFNKTPPPVVLEGIYFDRQPVSPHRKTVSEAPKGTGEIRFVFTAPTFLSPEKIKFRYRLEGFETEWVFLPPGAERSAVYKNLEPGGYTFQLTACNGEGVWNRTGVSFAFVLKPFFYQTALFKIAFLLLVVFLFSAAIYIYKKRPFDKKVEHVKYKDSPLNPFFAEECIKKLNHLVEVDKIYCETDISLQRLAQKLSVTPHQLSQLLNEKVGHNFFDFINSHRVEEVKRILSGPRGDEIKMSSVAHQVGFNTMPAFYNSFKRYTGMTPNQYKAERFKKNVQEGKHSV